MRYFIWGLSLGAVVLACTDGGGEMARFEPASGDAGAVDVAHRDSGGSPDAGEPPVFPGFSWLRQEMFSAGGQTRSVHVYRNEVFAEALGLGPTQTDVAVEFVFVPSGRFTMGSTADERAQMVAGGAVASRLADEAPQRTVDVGAFLLARTEVTQGLWRALADLGALAESPSYFANAGDRAPVETVSWRQAREWMAAINQERGLALRFPSEAEWEYAARAGTTTTLFSGPMTLRGRAFAPELDPIAWYMGNAGVDYPGGVDASGFPERQYDYDTAGTHPVAMKQPNAFGLFDMLGNVMEWCEDYAHASYEGAPVDGQPWLDGDWITGETNNGPASQVPVRCRGGDPIVPGRMRRGGSWRNFAYNTRSAIRSHRPPIFCDSNQGFRLAFDLRGQGVTPELVNAPVPGSAKALPPSDATDDAAGFGQVFELIHAPGLSDFPEGTNGLALADLDGDGWLDVVTVSLEPFNLQTEGDDVRDRLRVLINRRDWRFEAIPIALRGSAATPADLGQGWRGSQVPALADFNGDGWLDLFVSRQSPSVGGTVRAGFRAVGNSLFISDGGFDRFVDRSEALGIGNGIAYNRQPSLGDVDQDGYIDIAVGADNTTNAFEGTPQSALFVFAPGANGFSDGRFVDIGGTDQIPDYGGFYRDSERDKAGPNVVLRDIDNDGDLDLLQSTHALINGRFDVRALPLSPVLYRQGVFTWRNLLRETGRFRFEKSVDNGLAVEERLRFDEDQGLYVAEGEGLAPGLAYLLTADVDNDGRFDVVVVDGSDRTFKPAPADVGGRFWLNQGDFRFVEATAAAGLSSLNDTYEAWYRFFDNDVPSELLFANPLTPFLASQPGLTPTRGIDLRPYHADAVFADFNNDTWVDLVVLDRREANRLETRSLLYLNRGAGRFEPQPTTISGLDATGIAGEAGDLNNDGWVDLIVLGDPDNSTADAGAADAWRYEDKVYLNTLGQHSSNHWLRLRFSGVSHAALLGARIEVFDPDDGARLGTRGIYSNQSYKTGSALQAHFGLGDHPRVDVRITLLNGSVMMFADVEADRFLDVDLAAGTLAAVR